MNRQQEEYIHLANSIDSFNTAWRILKRIKDEKDNPLAGFAFQFALIEYSKPYKKSNSLHRNAQGKPEGIHKLGTEFIPERYLQLHKRIIITRDKILAHLDLDVRDAKLYVQSTEKGINVIRSQNIIDGTREMENIDDIIDLIEKTLDELYKEARDIQDDLPSNT